MHCMVVIAVLHISITSLHLKCCITQLFINSRTPTLFVAHEYLWSAYGHCP